MKPPRNGTGRLSCLLNGKDLGAFQSWEGLAGKTVRKNVMTPIQALPLSFVKPILAILAHEQEEAISFGPLIERANVSC